MKKLQEFPRIPLAVLPTPIQKLENISRLLNTNVYVKRDDLTGIGLGGNKVRKLEFLLADAKRQGAEIVFTTGGAQSNHAMLTAACAKKLGLTPILILKKRGVTERKGNQLLEYLMDTDVRFMDTDSYDDIYAEMDRVGQASGKKYYKIPCGGSNAIGALGYVSCAEELLWQSSQLRLRIDHIVHATGSAGTQAGLITGLTATHSGIPLLGISVRAPREKQEHNVWRLAQQTRELLGVPGELPREAVVANSDYVGEGYGLPTEGMLEALQLLAQHEGILLDPVYSGKGMAGLIDLIRKGHFRRDENVVFIHTGGSAGLFGYRQVIADSLPS